MESFSVCLGMALLLGLLHLGAAVQHTVGDAAGWKLNVSYTSWASNQNFQPGDTLLFKYTALRHNVAELNSQAAFDKCNVSGAIAIHEDLNGTIVKLSADDRRWFVCLISDHCQQGMKLRVRVGTTAAAPAPAPAGKGIPPPVPGSAAPIYTAAPALVALATALLFA